MYTADAPVRRRALPPPLPAPRLFTRRGEPLSAQTTGSVSRAECQANTRHQRDPDDPDLACPLVRLAASLGYRSATDFYPLASPGVPAVLALALQPWTATATY